MCVFGSSELRSLGIGPWWMLRIKCMHMCSSEGCTMERLDSSEGLGGYDTRKDINKGV